MGRLVPLLLLATLLVAAAAAAPSSQDDDSEYPYKVVCYYGSWAVYRPGLGKFDVEDIDPFLCTHLIYTFAGLDPGTHTIRSLDPWNDLYDDYGKGAFLRFTGLKAKNPQLKTLLAIGGWNEGSESYSEMTASAEHRKIFIDSVVTFLHKFNFDGLDLDWEYPAQRGGKARDIDSFGDLVRELSDALVPQDLLLTAAVGQSRATIDAAYHLSDLGKYLDIVNVMAYDYHGAWDGITGHNAPIYVSQADKDHGDGFGEFSVNWTMHHFLEGGVPAHKLVMGVPIYGRGFILDNPADHGLLAPARNPMPACQYTRQAGICGFNEICQMLLEGGWNHVTDAELQATYAYKADVWLGYDDLLAVVRKTDIIKQLGLGGGMVWSLETDDRHNLCGMGTPRPFLSALWTALNGPLPVPATTAAPTGPTLPAPTTHPTPGPTNICNHEGLNPDPTKKCSAIFYQCQHVGPNWRVTELECAGGLVFDQTNYVCTWPQLIPECQ